MQDDEDIDFEEVMNQERQKLQEQERKDAEMARKLMDDERRAASCRGKRMR